MGIEECLFIGLASWRIANMLVNEDGPGLIFEKVRDVAGANRPGKIEGFLSSVFSCVFCMSVWTTLGAFLLWLLIPEVVIIIAAMAVALVVHKLAKLD